MTAAWRSVPLGEVLVATSRPERVDPTAEYWLLGVRLDGEGPFLRETKSGTLYLTSVSPQLYRPYLVQA